MMTSVLLHTFDGQSDVESIRAFVVLHGQIVVTGVVHFDALDT
jgi:cobalamin synthase